ncbi:FecCD family ABC transporter permease [Corynebacterium mendelii]|uniref:Iron chelate uptake ABC transporter family permease subunit n=1 Tax=Corynebacterium mendelii TaxID=2765362 RepID=A0A939E023_9CORY|nr:iron chelate uptake ABC transporter family permease subunit [Corynebacterium mendelii]MBN9643964.1 iron chelate uptake ABC transporter family permease subunit [Corynebacterium mendelii]
MTVSATSVPGRPRVVAGPLVTVWRPQPIVVTVLMLAAAAVMAVAAAGTGDQQLSSGRVIAILAGGGDAAQRQLVIDYLLPRSIGALCVGAALALAGAITQSLTRKPLASPDVLGITATGAATAVTVASVGGSAVGRSGWGTLFGVPAACFFGCLAAGSVVLWLARKKRLDIFRLVCVGLCVTLLMQAVVRWVLVGAGADSTRIAHTFMFGSLSRSTWQSVTPVIMATAVAVVVLLALSFRLKAITLGEATANGLGVHVRGTWIILTVIALALCAVAVTAAGPIMFIAFAAPQLALRLSNTATAPLAPSAATGGALLVAADLVARLIPGSPPVGLVTGLVGGCVFIVFLIRTNQRTTA